MSGKRMLSGSICVTDIPKEKCKKAKNGKYYLDVTVWVDSDADKYGNHASLVVGQTKEESDAKTPKQYLGNLKGMWSNNEPLNFVKAENKTETVNVAADDNDGFPF